jgi:hypothetical protein
MSTVTTPLILKTMILLLQYALKTPSRKFCFFHCLISIFLHYHITFYLLHFTFIIPSDVSVINVFVQLSFDWILQKGFLKICFLLPILLKRTRVVSVLQF